MELRQLRLCGTGGRVLSHGGQSAEQALGRYGDAVDDRRYDRMIYFLWRNGRGESHCRVRKSVRDIVLSIGMASAHVIER